MNVQFELSLQTQFAGKSVKYSTTPLSFMSRAFHTSYGGEGGGILFVVWILTSRVSALVSEPGDPRHVIHDCPQLNYSQVGAQQLVAQISSVLSLEGESSTPFSPFFYCHLCLHEYP